MEASQSNTGQQAEFVPESSSAKKQSIRATERENGISYRAARNMVLGIQPAGSTGRPTKFTAEEEKHLEEMMIAAADIDFLLTGPC